MIACTSRRIFVRSLLLGSSGILFGSRFFGENGDAAIAQTVSIPPSLFDDPASPVAGNPKGKVTIVEFFDYRCPYCRMMEPILNDILKHNKQVRLIMKDWPIFGGISVYAAQVAIASGWQGKYLAAHDALFALPRTMDRASIRDAVQKAGVDLKQLDRDLSQRASDINAILARNNEEAQALHLQGTPGFVIGKIVVPGALTEDQLQQLVDQAEQT